MRFMGISWDFMEISFGLNGDFMGSLWDVLGKSQESSGNLTIGLEQHLLIGNNGVFLHISLVVDGYPPETYEFVSWDYSSQYMGKTCSKPPTRYVFFEVSIGFLVASREPIP